MKKDFIHKASVAAVIIIVLIILFSLPVRIPESIRATGKMIPNRIFTLATGTDGQLNGSLYNSLIGTNEDFFSLHFERGDDIRYQVSNVLMEKGHVNAGDTIAKVSSFLLEQQLTELRGELLVSEALLSLYKSGEKPEVVLQALEELEYLKTDARIQQKLFERQKGLYDSAVITDQEFELHLRESELKQLRAEIKEKELDVLTTGAKKEYLNYIMTQIEKTKSAIELLELKLVDYVIMSPVSGEIRNSNSGDTLIAIYEKSDPLVYIAVDHKELPFLSPGMDVSVFIPGSNEKLEAKIVKINREVTLLNSQQVFYLIGRVNPGQLIPPAGTIVRCRIEKEKKSLSVFFSDVINRIISSS